MSAILGIFAGPHALIAKWLVIGLVIAATFGAGWIKGNAHGTQKLTDFVAKQATEAARIAVVRSAATERVVIKYLTKTVPETRTVRETIEKEVIRYETAKLDTCPLSAGARSLHDSAAANTVPDAARSTDGAASGLEVAALAKTCTENYAVYHETADRLRALQEWVRAQEGVR